MGRFYHHLLHQKLKGEKEAGEEATPTTALPRQQDSAPNTDSQRSNRGRGGGGGSEGEEEGRSRERQEGRENDKASSESKHEQMEYGDETSHGIEPRVADDSKVAPQRDVAEEEGEEAVEERGGEEAVKTAVDVRELTTAEKEERRRVAALKRANEESLLSARDRYLARKKAKLTT